MHTANSTHLLLYCYSSFSLVSSGVTDRRFFPRYLVRPSPITSTITFPPRRSKGSKYSFPITASEAHCVVHGFHGRCCFVAIKVGYRKEGQQANARHQVFEKKTHPCIYWIPSEPIPLLQ